MLICNDGKTVGSLSAGCLEEEVALRARQVLLTGEPALMSFDTRKRFGCAGKIDIFIECAAENFFVDLAENLDARRCCAAITRFAGDKVGTRIQGFDYEHPPSPGCSENFREQPARQANFAKGPLCAQLTCAGPVLF